LKGSIVAAILLFICLALFPPPVMAQKGVPLTRNRIPFARAGLYLGRTGIAEGPGAYLEINPLPWLGFCAVVSHSQTNQEEDGGHARVSDISAGGCVTAHFPEAKGFLISPFVELANQHEHDRFALLLDDGTTYRDGSDGRHRAWLVGSTIDRAITKNGPRWAVQIARNFGGGPAAKNVGGLYLVGGLIFPLDHPTELGRSLRRIAGSKKSSPDSASGQPQ
jgi:hypothetical protein